MTVTVHIIQAGMGCAHLIEGDAGLVLVDAGSPGNEHRILRQVRAIGRDDLRLIFITHAHFDHDGSAAALRRMTGAPIAIHRADAGALARGETQLGTARGRGIAGQVVLELLGMHLRAEPASADILLEEGDDLNRYGLDAVVLHTPGHTPGSVCLYDQAGTLFSGDTLFEGGPGATQIRFGDFELIIRSIGEQLLVLPGETVVHTGHGASTTIGAEAPHLRAWIRRGW